MKRLNFTFALAILLSVSYILIEIWNGFTRQLGGFYYPDETRSDAVVGSIIFATLVCLLLFGLLVALKKRKSFAVLVWIFVSPALIMLSWDTITKNLVENGRLAAGWLTDSAYLEEPGARLHRTGWITIGALAALPFLYNAYIHFKKSLEIE